MDKLWVRLSLAFSAVVLLAVFIVLTTGLIIAQAERFLDYEEELIEPGGLIQELQQHYQYHQNWNEAEPLIRGARTTFRGRRYADLTFFLADADKKIIYHPQVRNTDKHLADVSQTQVFPIQVDGRPVGYLAVGPLIKNRSDMSGPPFSFLSTLLLTFAVVTGISGILFGVLVSRSLTAPLNRLAKSARAIGARDLSQRVEVTGSREMKDVAIAFNEMATGLDQAEQLRRNLIADVAHELRTPLSVLQGNLRAILDEVYPLDKAEVTRLYDQTRLLSRLVTDLHELAQAEARQLPLNMQETNLSALISSVSDTFAPIVETKSIDLQTNLAAAIPALEVDAARLTQVLNNLLNNALRHTPQGGRITINTQHTASTIRIDFIDTGEGVPPEHLPHIFDRFYRTDPARSRDKGGAGLGLAIARAIVEAHDGTISVTSAGIAGQGSTFTVQLPLHH